MSDSHNNKPFDATADADNPSTIVFVYLAVLGLAAANIALSFAGLHALTLPVQMGISTVQAILVAFFWMPLRRKDKVVTLPALAALFWTGILFVLFLVDFVTRWRGGL